MVDWLIEKKKKVNNKERRNNFIFFGSEIRGTTEVLLVPASGVKMNKKEKKKKRKEKNTGRDRRTTWKFDFCFKTNLRLKRMQHTKTFHLNPMQDPQVHSDLQNHPCSQDILSPTFLSFLSFLSFLK